MSPVSSRLLALLLPVACVGLAESLLSILSADSERPYVMRFAGLLLLTQLAMAAMAGFAWSLVGRKDTGPASGRNQVALALGLGLALATLAILANGLPRQIPPGTVPLPLAWFLAAAFGLGAALLRRLVSRSPTGGALLWEPVLLSMATVGTYGMLRLRRLPPATLSGAMTWALIAAACLLLALFLNRFRRQPSPALAWLPVLAAVAGAMVMAAMGRSPFPALPEKTSGNPDVLLIVLDTTRADAVPAREGSPWPTPALQRLAAEGRTHTRCFSTSCWTVPAHASLFTGRLPFGHGASWSNTHLGPEAPTLAQQFADAGWSTAGFSANPWISTEFGFDRGFQSFTEVNADRRPLRPWVTAFLPAAWTAPALDMFDDKGGLTLTSEALRRLGRDPQPQFIFLNLLEPHLPYLPPRRFRDTVVTGRRRDHDLYAFDQEPLTGLTAAAGAAAPDMGIVKDLYAAEIAYTDSLLGQILRRLDESGRTNHTVVMITADHGENLGDHPPLDHQLGLYDSLVHVPLLLRYPAAISAGSLDHDLISLTDLPGRLLTLAGARASQTGAAGDPGAPDPREAVFFEYARPLPVLERIRARLGIDPAPWDRSLRGVRTATHKWIEASDGRHQAFDLLQDPGETRNLQEVGVTPAGAWLDLNRQLHRRLPAAADSAAARPLEMAPETRERLRSLGYLE